jgi:hypothetical protein
MQSHPSPKCKAARACKAAHARKAGLTHDNALLAVKLITQKAPESRVASGRRPIRVQEAKGKRAAKTSEVRRDDLSSNYLKQGRRSADKHSVRWAGAGHTHDCRCSCTPARCHQGCHPDKTLTSATSLYSSKLCLLQTVEAKQQNNYQQQQASRSNKQHACISDHDS